MEPSLTQGMENSIVIVSSATIIAFPQMTLDPEIQQCVISDSRMRVTLNFGEGEETVPADRLGLIRHIPYFKRELRPDDSISLEQLDLDLEAVKLLVQLTYTGKLEVSEENVANLIVAANKLGMEEVQNKCMEFLIKQLSPNNCFQVRDFASQYKFENLLKEVEEKFRDYSYLDLKTAIESSSKENEEVIFQVIKLWIAKGKETRMSHLYDLLQLVDLKKLVNSSMKTYEMVGEEFSNGVFKGCQRSKDLFLATVLQFGKQVWSQGQTNSLSVNPRGEQTAGPYGSGFSGSNKRHAHVEDTINLSVVESEPEDFLPSSSPEPAKERKKSASAVPGRKLLTPATAVKSSCPSGSRKSITPCQKTVTTSLVQVAPAESSSESESDAVVQFAQVPVDSITEPGPSSASCFKRPPPKRSTPPLDQQGPSSKCPRTTDPSSSGPDLNVRSIKIIYALFQGRKKFIHCYDFEAREPTTRTVHAVKPRRRLSTLAFYNEQVFDIGGTLDFKKIDEETRATDRLEVFDPSRSSRSAALTMPEPSRDSQSCICNGCLYTIGGCQLDEKGGDTPINCVDRIKLTERVSNTTAWDNDKNLPYLLYVRGNHAACVLDSKIYVIGGIGLLKCETEEEKKKKNLKKCEEECVTLRSVECFDPRGKDWIELSPMKEARAFHRVAVMNGRIYAAGGNVYKSTQVLNTVEVFNPNDNSWMTCPPMNNPRTKFLLIARKNQMFAIGGDSERNPTMEMFDLQTQEWHIVDWPVDLPKNMDFYSAISTSA